VGSRNMEFPTVSIITGVATHWRRREHRGDNKAKDVLRKENVNGEMDDA